MSEREKDGFGAIEGTHAAPGAGDRGSAGGAGSLPAVASADDQRLDGLLPIGISPIATTGPGRPKGAKNRRTDLVAQYLVDRFGDPLTASMSIAGRPLGDLIRELRCIASDHGLKLGASVMDIARFQQQCRVDALPYIHAKRAPETHKGDPVVPIIGIGSVSQTSVTVVSGGRSLEDALDARLSIIEHDQGVSGEDAEMSHGEKSHDAPSD